MRSSKQRQRNKQNRPVRPSGGNVVNRVFDSSGPEGKVRGTPAQIIEKYTQLHRDAQLGGDRVAAENFAQHAEHYTRMLAEAQRDIDRVRDEQDQWNRERQAERDRQMEQSRERHQGGEPRSGDARAVEARSGEGRADPRDGQRTFEPRPDRSERPFEARAEGGRDRDRQPRFRGRDDAAPAPAAEAPSERPSERPSDEGARMSERRDDAAPGRVEDARENNGAQGSEPSFLRQPLFPILVAEPEDDMAAQDAGPALVETPESRTERQPEPRRRGPRRETRAETRPAPEPRATGGPELTLTDPVSAEAAAPRVPRARRPRKPRAEEPTTLDVAPDAAE